jgi:hypothetical protein
LLLPAAGEKFLNDKSFSFCSFSISAGRHRHTALTHFKFDATALSLDDVYKGLCRDKETFYFLWVAVRKVLEEAPNVTKLDIFFPFIKKPPPSSLICRACGIWAELIGHMTSMKRFSGARVGADQKSQILDGLLDAALEQLVSFPFSARRLSSAT